ERISQRGGRHDPHVRLASGCRLRCMERGLRRVRRGAPRPRCQRSGGLPLARRSERSDRLARLPGPGGCRVVRGLATATAGDAARGRARRSRDLVHDSCLTNDDLRTMRGDPVADVTIKRVDEMEAIWSGSFVRARASLGACSFGMNIWNVPAGWESWE